MRSMITVGTLALALGVLSASAQTPGTPPSPNMPAPAGLQHRIDDATGTSGELNRGDAEQSSLPDTASPLGLIALGGLAALSGAAALRRVR